MTIGKAREVNIQLASSDMVKVTSRRHKSATPLAIGQKIAVWGCVARHSNFHNKSMVLHVNSAFELEVS